MVNYDSWSHKLFVWFNYRIVWRFHHDYADRRYEKFIGRQYHRQQQKWIKNWPKSDTYKKIKACDHKNRRPNPDATRQLDKYVYYICNDCNIGLSFFRS